MIDTTFVNPGEIRKGDKIRKGSKTHQVKNAGPCSSKPEMFHIDGDCYDTRFSLVERVNG